MSVIPNYTYLLLYKHWSFCPFYINSQNNVPSQLDLISPFPPYLFQTSFLIYYVYESTLKNGSMVITLLCHLLLEIWEWLQFLFFYIFKKMFFPRFFGDMIMQHPA